MSEDTTLGVVEIAEVAEDKSGIDDCPLTSSVTLGVVEIAEVSEDTSKVDNCPLTSSVTLGVVEIAEVNEDTSEVDNRPLTSSVTLGVVEIAEVNEGTSKVDDCPLSESVTLDVVVIAEVAEVGVASAPRSGRDDEVRVSCKASRSEVDTSAGGALLEVVSLVKTKRLISFFKKRGLSTSSRGCAGAAAAKHVAESSVDSNARDTANITEDLRNMMEMECDGRRDLYYENR